MHARKLVLTRQHDLDTLRESLLKIRDEAAKALAGEPWGGGPIKLIGLDELESQVPDAMYLRSDRVDSYLSLIYVCRQLEIRIKKCKGDDWFSTSRQDLAVIQNLANVSLNAMESVLDTFKRVQKNSIPTVLISYPPGQQTFDEPY
ncbi:MAG: hypothetical protein Q8Q73_13815 [Stagnimonas sp.]|nr:hypothetical protein [Stagnimonas sp.]